MKWEPITKNNANSLLEGWYVILLPQCSEPKIAYYGHRNWQRPWYIPDEWKDPIYCFSIDAIENFTNTRSHATMD